MCLLVRSCGPGLVWFLSFVVCSSSPFLFFPSPPPPITFAGTGTNGDHASGANVFQAFFECGSPSEGTMGGSGNTISGTVAAPGGSQPGGFDVTLTIPAGATGDCTVSIKDQRNWGAHVCVCVCVCVCLN